MTKRTPGRILLVDHSRGGLLFQETILRRRDNVITSALAGSEALIKARAEIPSLILFTYDLFDMSAPEFCRAIRGTDETRFTSLLLVSEKDQQPEAELCLSAGCNDVVYRPFERHELDLKVRRLTAIPARRQLRTITRIEVSFENNGRFILGRSVNVSSTGMLVEVDRVLPGDGRLRIHFFLPGDPKPLAVPAEVLRAEFSGVTARYGLRFLDLASEEKERIERFVTRLRSREAI